MKHLLKEIYGVGILFFYYIKWPIFIGLPILYSALEYTHNSIMDVLWIYSFVLIIKDFILGIVLKKKYDKEDR